LEFRRRLGAIKAIPDSSNLSQIQTPAVGHTNQTAQGNLQIQALLLSSQFFLINSHNFVVPTSSQ